MKTSAVALLLGVGLGAYLLTQGTSAKVYYTEPNDTPLLIVEAQTTAPLATVVMELQEADLLPLSAVAIRGGFRFELLIDDKLPGGIRFAPGPVSFGKGSIFAPLGKFATSAVLVSARAMTGEELDAKVAAAKAAGLLAKQ